MAPSMVRDQSRRAVSRTPGEHARLPRRPPDPPVTSAQTALPGRRARTAGRAVADRRPRPPARPGGDHHLEVVRKRPAAGSPRNCVGKDLVRIRVDHLPSRRVQRQRRAPGAPRGRHRPPPRAATSRNSSVSVGCRQLKCSTRPAAARGGEHLLVVGAVGELEHHLAATLRHHASRPGSCRPSRRARPARSPAVAGGLPGARRSSTVPVATIRPALMIPTESQSRSTRSS